MSDEQERADLERRLNAGEWLKPGSVAKLLGVGRTKVHTLMGDKVIRYRKTPGGVHRFANPEDVRRLLDESRRVHGGDSPTD